MPDVVNEGKQQKRVTALKRSPLRMSQTVKVPSGKSKNEQCSAASQHVMGQRVITNSIGMSL